MPQFSNGTLFFPQRWLRHGQHLLCLFTLDNLDFRGAVERLFLVFPLPAHASPYTIQVSVVEESWNLRPFVQIRKKPPRRTPMTTIPIKPMQRKAFLDVTSQLSQWETGSHHGYYVRYGLPGKRPLLPPQLAIHVKGAEIMDSRGSQQGATSPKPSITAVNWERIERGIFSRFEEELLLSEALYRGGEALVEQRLPVNQVLHLHSVAEIIEAGIQQLHSELIPLVSTENVKQLIQQALDQGSGYSLIRLGDGEMLTLCQGTIFSPAEVEMIGGHFLPYSGITIGDEAHRNKLLNSILQANLIGIPVSRLPHFQGLFRQIWQHHQLPLRELTLTSSLINYKLDEVNFVFHLLKHYRVLLVGNVMQQLHQRLHLEGFYNVVGAVPVRGMNDIPHVMERMQHYHYDIAFVSAGVAAAVLCPLIAQQGKVAIDFGHMANQLCKRKPLFPQHA